MTIGFCLFQFGFETRDFALMNRQHIHMIVLRSTYFLYPSSVYRKTNSMEFPFKCRKQSNVNAFEMKWLCLAGNFAQIAIERKKKAERRLRKKVNRFNRREFNDLEIMKIIHFRSKLANHRLNNAQQRFVHNFGQNGNFVLMILKTITVSFALIWFELLSACG